jgi:hypothetical protein
VAKSTSRPFRGNEFALNIYAAHGPDEPEAGVIENYIGYRYTNGGYGIIWRS